jgi:hypothetical protein
MNVSIVIPVLAARLEPGIQGRCGACSGFRVQLRRPEMTHMAYSLTFIANQDLEGFPTSAPLRQYCPKDQQMAV